MSGVMSNAKNVAGVYGEDHPYALISYVTDFVSENFGDGARVIFRKLNGKTLRFCEIRRLWNEGRLCWCVIND